jgi:hypothetical protein
MPPPSLNANSYLCIFTKQLHAFIEAHVDDVVAIRAHVGVVATARVGNTRCWPPPAAQQAGQ